MADTRGVRTPLDISQLRCAPLPPTNDDNMPVLETDDRLLRVRFEPGFGLNIHIEMWDAPDSVSRRNPKDWTLRRQLAMSITGWQSIVDLVHQYDRWVEEAP